MTLQNKSLILNRGNGRYLTVSNDTVTSLNNLSFLSHGDKLCLRKIFGGGISITITPSMFTTDNDGISLSWNNFRHIPLSANLQVFGNGLACGILTLVVNGLHHACLTRNPIDLSSDTPIDVIILKRDNLKHYIEGFSPFGRAAEFFKDQNDTALLSKSLDAQRFDRLASSAALKKESKEQIRKKKNKRKMAKKSRKRK